MLRITAAQIDEKVVAAVRKQYDKAEQLLKDNMPKLHELAKYLYEKETITGDEFMEILNLSPDQLTTTRMEQTKKRIKADENPAFHLITQKIHYIRFHQ